MKLFLKDVAAYIEKISPVSLACEWDNVGLIIGNSDKPIKRIVVCLDLTREVLDFAIQKNANLILSHHPFIFKGVKKINTKESYGKMVEDIIKNDICVYAAHTNFDFAHNGLNDLLAKVIDLHYSNSLYLGQSKDRIVGKIGEVIGDKTFGEFAEKVKEKLNVDNVRIAGDVDKVVKRVAVFCGSFDENFLNLVTKRADVIVTGDLKHHVVLDIMQKGLCAIDAGHFGTEHIFVDYIKRLLTQNFDGIEVFALSDEKDLFKYL